MEVCNERRTNKRGTYHGCQFASANLQHGYVPLATVQTTDLLTCRLVYLIYQFVMEYLHLPKV